MMDIETDLSGESQARENFKPWMLDLAEGLAELANEYPNFRVVTHVLAHSEEEAIPGDAATVAPLVDLSADDLFIRFVTNGLRPASRASAPQEEALRLSNAAIRLRRLAADNPELAAAFVERFGGMGPESLWFVSPVESIALRVNEEIGAVCMLGRSWPKERFSWFGFIHTSLRRMWTGIWQSGDE